MLLNPLCAQADPGWVVKKAIRLIVYKRAVPAYVLAQHDLGHT